MKGNRQLYNIARKLMEANTDFMFVQITKSSGSAPRKAGACMLVLPDGKTIGTVGGGSIEYTASLDAITAFNEQKSFTKDYDLSNKKAAEFGMICGGHVTLDFHFISSKDTDFYEYLLAESEKHESTVYIFGGGHVAQELVPVLAHLDFSCVVFDDRPEFSNKEVFPDASQCIVGDFESITDFLDIQEKDFVCIMTRGHQFDYLVQKQILQTNAHYIGVMGSRKKTQIIHEKLLADGFREADLSRLKSPIGLEIKAETPAEIAISIAAELILTQYS